MLFVVDIRNVEYVGGSTEVHTVFWWGNLKEGDNLQDPGINGSIILKSIFEKWDGGMDWFDLAQDRER
jgi:hypothetical protein